MTDELVERLRRYSCQEHRLEWHDDCVACTTGRECHEAADKLDAANERSNDEKRRRVYYQDIVYGVCNVLDKVHGGTVQCGTVDEPNRNVLEGLWKMQDRFKALGRDREALRKFIAQHDWKFDPPYEALTEDE